MAVPRLDNRPDRALLSLIRSAEKTTTGRSDCSGTSNLRRRRRCSALIEADRSWRVTGGEKVAHRTGLGADGSILQATFFVGERKAPFEVASGEELSR